MKRRALLLSGVGAAGAVVVGWALLPPRERLGGVGALPVADGDSLPGSVSRGWKYGTLATIVATLP